MLGSLAEDRPHRQWVHDARTQIVRVHFLPTARTKSFQPLRRRGAVRLRGWVENELLGPLAEEHDTCLKGGRRATEPQLAEAVADRLGRDLRLAGCGIHGGELALSDPLPDLPALALLCLFVKEPPLECRENSLEDLKVPVWGQPISGLGLRLGPEDLFVLGGVLRPRKMGAREVDEAAMHPSRGVPWGVVHEDSQHDLA